MSGEELLFLGGRCCYTPTPENLRIVELEQRLATAEEELEEERGARLRTERMGKLERRWQP